MRSHFPSIGEFFEWWDRHPEAFNLILSLLHIFLVWEIKFQKTCFSVFTEKIVCNFHELSNDNDIRH